MISYPAVWKSCGKSLIQFRSISGSETLLYGFIFSVFLNPAPCTKMNGHLEVPQSNHSLGHRIPPSEEAGG